MNEVADLCRLLAVPAFGWVAWRDVATRRVADRTWVPLLVLACVALVWDLLLTDAGTERLFLFRVALSVGLVVPLSYLFWRLGGFGGADAKAFMILSILFPVYPTYELFATTFPPVETTLGIFSLTIVTNTVLVGIIYPLALAARNAFGGTISLRAFVGRPIDWVDSTTEYGRLLGVGPGRGGLDLDALRMYLRWRGLSLRELREGALSYRDPESLPNERNPPGDGAIRGTRTNGSAQADGGVVRNERERVTEPREEATESESDRLPETDDYEDPWGAATFLADIDSSAYGTTPADLRAGLDALTTEETVWITPGIPFLVPLFFGLCIALLYGDLLFGGLRALGLL